MMLEPLKLGVIGLDTSHCVAFTNMLNLESNPHFIPGARVVAAFPSFSPDVEASHSRVDRFTKEMRDDLGVEILESIEAVCEKVDAVLIESVDGRRHLSEFRKVAEAGKPCFIDKPFTASLSDAREIARLARESGVRVFSSSSLRFVPEIKEIMDDPDGVGTIQRVHVFSPASLEPTNPGLFWYGIHGIEMIYAFLGAGCEWVAAFSDEKGDSVASGWTGGRAATYAGTRLSKNDYGAVVHGSQKTVAFVCNLKDIYAPLVRSIVEFFRGAKPPVAIETTLEIISFIDAALRSEGDRVRLSPNQ